MKNKWMIAAALTGATLAHAQMGRTFDWYTAGGDSQHSNSEKNDSKFTKDTVKDFKLLLQRKLEGTRKGVGPLMAPVVLGNLISYRGFKELAFVANGGGDVWAVDADLDRIFWERHLDLPKGKSKGNCPAGVTSQPAMTPGVDFGKLFRPARPANGGPPPPPSQSAVRRAFAPRPVFLLGNDGTLYRLDTSTGKDIKPPVPFIPAGAYASAVNVSGDVVYVTTNGGCGGKSDAVWALPIGEDNSDGAKAASFEVADGLLARGVVIGTDGSVYAETANGIITLSAGDLKAGESFKFSAAEGTSPLVFPYKGRDLLAAAGKDGSLYLFDSKAPGEPIYRTPTPLGAGTDGGLRGGLTTWEADSTRWVLATVWGPLHSGFKAPATNGEISNGAVVAFKIEEQAGKPALTPQWISRDLSAPQTPVAANGVVFALSSGDYERASKPRGHATLYAFDGATGKEIYSTGEEVSAPANMTGLTLANGRAYFTTTDNTLYAFGYYLEH